MDFKEGDLLIISRSHEMLEVDGSTLVFERMDDRGRGHAHYLVPHPRFGTGSVYFYFEYVEKL